MTRGTARGRSTRKWQYHSRSDTHSKVACWAVLFDLLIECDSLKNAAMGGHVGFGINHVMVGPINKSLDLVVTVAPSTRQRRRRTLFSDLVERHGIVLSDEDRLALQQLPALEMDHKDDISEVAIALEAKACMTEHIKSLPRLHAEILATGYLAKRAAPRCITVSYSIVNAADTFLTPSKDGKLNAHSQPEDARRVVEMIANAVPMVSDSRDFGYDVVGITALACKNDGSPVQVLNDPKVAPRRNERTHYEHMIRNICSEYRNRFGRSLSN